MDLGLPPKPSRESLVAMCRENPEAVADLVLMLWGKVEELAATAAEQAATIAAQGEEIAALKAKLAKDSHNSSKPPSSDRHNPGGGPPPKTKAKGGKKRKAGGQPGHLGKTLEMSGAPDHVVELPRPARCRCGRSLRGAPRCAPQRRQVFDLPEEITVEVTEYRAPVCRCPGCGKKSAAEFPEGVKAPVQYGPRVKATAAYLHVHHLLPYGRLAGLFADLFGCRLAAGTLPRFVGEAAARAGPLHGKIREAVASSEHMHNDETGLGVLAKTSWLHVACTREYVFFEVTPGRSFEDIRSVGVLEGYRGRSVHDFLPAYLKFEGVEHGLCNAHHLRDLAFVAEQSGNAWPEEMAGLLLEAKKHTDRAASAGGAVPARTVRRLREKYMGIVAAGYGENPEPEREPGKKGRPARGKELCLLDRFAAYEEETLAFLLHGVPFDNNEAERDLRMMKTRQKISGCFRSLEWSKRFAKVRSVIATARKKKVDVYALLKKLFTDPAGAEEMLFAT